MRGLLITLFLSFLLSYAVRYFLWARFRRLAQKRRGGAGPVSDRFVECPACGTYNPMQTAYQADGSYYCKPECYEKRKAES